MEQKFIVTKSQLQRLVKKDIKSALAGGLELIDGQVIVWFHKDVRSGSYEFIIRVNGNKNLKFLRKATEEGAKIIASNHNGKADMNKYDDLVIIYSSEEIPNKHKAFDPSDINGMITFIKSI